VERADGKPPHPRSETAASIDTAARTAIHDAIQRGTRGLMPAHLEVLGQRLPERSDLLDRIPPQRVVIAEAPPGALPHIPREVGQGDVLRGARPPADLRGARHSSFLTSV